MTDRGAADIAQDAMQRGSSAHRASGRITDLRGLAANVAAWADSRLVWTLVLGSGVIVAAGFWSPLLSVALAGPLIAALATVRPGWVLALALNGFFLYLALLDVTGHGPRTLVTGIYYAIVAACMAWAAWSNRDMVLSRIGARTTLFTVCALSSLALAGWFLVNAAVFRDGGDQARTLAALLILSSLPAAALAFALTRSGLAQLRFGLVGLGLLFVVADLVAIVRGPALEAGRFSPLEDMDPINAGLVPAVAAIAAASFAPSSRRGYVLQAVTVLLLVAATLAPGSRGPVFSLAGAMVVLAVLRWRRSAVVPVGALALGLALGAIVSDSVGTSSYFGEGVHDVAHEIAPEKATLGSPTGISTFSMRMHWLEDAWEAFPERPVFGHGIATLRDTSPEAYRMGVAGGRIYPHNDVAEAAYSLGILGLVPFVVLLVIPACVLLLGRGRRRPARYALAAGAFTFAFLQSNVSGEIGADALLWSSSALVMALYLDDRRELPPRAPS